VTPSAGTSRNELREEDRRRRCPAETSPEAPEIIKPFDTFISQGTALATSEAAYREFNRRLQAALHRLRMNGDCPATYIGVMNVVLPWSSVTRCRRIDDRKCRDVEKTYVR
jgi:hypothetical protein